MSPSNSESDHSVTNIRVAKEVEQIKSFDPGLGAYRFEDLGQAVQFADLMARAGPMIPEHCQGQPAICLAITMRAQQWGFDPFGLAQETFQVRTGAPVGYSAKVFTSALRTCAGIALQYRYEGEVEILGEPAMSANGKTVAKRKAVGDRVCIAFAEVDGVVQEYTTPKLDDITIKNSALWHNDPDQQLAYYAGRGWARRFRAEVMMGAYSRDEVESMTMKDVTPAPTGFVKKIQDARAAANTTEDTPATETQDDSDTQSSTEDAQEAHTDDQDTHDHETGETPAHDADTQSEGYEFGAEAARADSGRGQCPFREDAVKAKNWLAGFDSVEVEDAQA